MQIGIDSRILYLIQNDKSIPNSAEFISESGKFSEIYNKLKLGLRYYQNKISLYGRKYAPEIFTYIDTPFDITEHDFIKDADVINLHWITHFLDWKSFFPTIDKPIFWTLHDQNPFTGGCHYSFKCIQYIHDCVQCPQLKGSIFNNSSENQLLEKAKIIKNTNDLSIITPSKWLSALSKQSLVMKNKKHFVINNGIETEELIAFEKKFAKEKLDLPLDKKILLFVSDNLNTEHKGFKLLLNALKNINNHNIFLISIGGGKSDSNLQNHKHLGYINTIEQLSLVYSASDLFINPSKMDNFPNTIIESHVCGTPVVGFPVCGIKEMIKTNENGILCKSADSSGLTDAITDFINEKYKFKNNEIRTQSLKHYTLERMAKEYYEEFNKKDS